MRLQGDSGFVQQRTSSSTIKNTGNSIHPRELYPIGVAWNHPDINRHIPPIARHSNRSNDRRSFRADAIFPCRTIAADELPGSQPQACIRPQAFTRTSSGQYKCRVQPTAIATCILDATECHGDRVRICAADIAGNLDVRTAWIPMPHVYAPALPGTLHLDDNPFVVRLVVERIACGTHRTREHKHAGCVSL